MLWYRKKCLLNYEKSWVPQFASPCIILFTYVAFRRLNSCYLTYDSIDNASIPNIAFSEYFFNNILRMFQSPVQSVFTIIIAVCSSSSPLGVCGILYSLPSANYNSSGATTHRIVGAPNIVHALRKLYIEAGRKYIYIYIKREPGNVYTSALTWNCEPAVEIALRMCRSGVELTTWRAQYNWARELELEEREEGPRNDCEDMK